MWKWLFGTGSRRLPKGMKAFRRWDEMTPGRQQLLEDMAYRLGGYFDSYLVTEPNREYLWGRNDRGVIGFSAVGRYLHVAGGLITPPEHRAEFLSEIVEFARLNGLTVSFFCIDLAEADLFRDQDFQVTRPGVDCRIPLPWHDWQGRDHRWVRRQVSTVQRQGVTTQEWIPAEMSRAEWRQRFAMLADVSEQHLAGKPQRGAIPFFEGDLIAGHLFRRRIFVACHPTIADRIEAFVLCNPMRNGSEWAIEMYRQRADAVRGAIPFLMCRVIDQLQAEGCRAVSLCPVLTIGCDQPLPRDSRLVRTAMVLWGRCLSSVFDVRGLYHYKSRFRPEFHGLCVCAWPRSSLRSILAYTTLVRTMQVKPGAVLKRLLRPPAQRRTLAVPATTPPLHHQPAAATDQAAGDPRARSEADTADCAVVSERPTSMP